MKHKHAELIKAWADGAEIEAKFYDNWWYPIADNNPSWNDAWEYRIKPKSDIASYLSVLSPTGIVFGMLGANLRLTFDGETGKLKSAEVI